jgi:hypothetical protein
MINKSANYYQLDNKKPKIEYSIYNNLDSKPRSTAVKRVKKFSMFDEVLTPLITNDGIYLRRNN